MIGEDGYRAEDSGVDLISAFLRWKTILLVSVTLSVGAAAFIVTMTPLYKASVEIMLPLSAIEDFSERKNLNTGQSDPLVVHSYVDIVENDGLCLKVIKKLHLEAKPEFQPKPSLVGTSLDWIKKHVGLADDHGPSLFSDEDRRRDNVLAIYKGMLTVKGDSKSLILDISFQMENPFLTTEIVNAQAAAFIDSQVAYRQHESDTKNGWLKAEVERAEEDARQAQLAIQLHPIGTALTARDAAVATTELKFRQMQATSKQAVYDALLSKYQALVGEGHYIGSDIRILSPAIVPTKPAAPKKLLLIAVTSLISVILGLTIAFIQALLASKHDLDTFVEAENVSIAGHLNFPKRSLLGWRRRRHRRAYFWEQVRQIRSGLRTSEDASTVIAITSPAAKDGKSLLAAALSQSYAIGGSRTVLLDLNLRNRSFYTPPTVALGLGSYLAGEVSANEAAVRVDPEMPLFLLTRAGHDKVDVDHLLGEKLRGLIGELRRSFDRIIVDTPALSIVSDGFFVADLADLVVMATTSDKTKLTSLRAAIESFRRRSIEISGLVVSDRQAPSARACDQLAAYTSGAQWREIWPKPPAELRTSRSWRFLKRNTERGPKDAAKPSTQMAITCAPPKAPKRSRRRSRRQAHNNSPKMIDA